MLDIDTAIKHSEEVAEQNETQADKIGRQLIGSAIDKYATNCRECAEDHRQLAEWLRELKDLREENKVLTSECDRLIKEKGELLSKVSGGDVLRICQLEEQLKHWKEEYANLNKISYGFYKEMKESKRLLKAAFEDLNATVAEVYNGGVICECCKWESQIGKCSCPDDGGCDTDYQWRYADEALKLLNDEK